MENEGCKTRTEAKGKDENTSTFKSKANKRFQILETQGFIVGRMLGQGSYASVRSAFDANRRHKVAIKIISKRKAPEDFLCRFLPREIEVIKILKHPCLISFYQVIETTTRFFLVMELGHVDMLDYIRCKKAIPEAQCGIWFRQFHDGMVYMHAKGVVHRDLKCENILLDKDYHLKITDFGFAKKVPTPKNLEEVPPSETYCGSFAYAPPEILMGTPYNPFFADVWSMGVVLFTMLYGRLPFDDSNHKKLLNQVQKRVVFPTKPEVSEACQTLLAKMLSLLPERVLLSNIQFEPWFKMFEQEDDKKSDNEETLIETQNLTSELDGEAS